MKIFRKKISFNNKLFDKHGNIILSEESAFFMDAIIVNVLDKDGISITELHREMFRCGIHVSNKELKETIEFLGKKSLVKY